MADLFKHPKTGVLYVRKAVPAAIRRANPKAPGEIKRSLGTKDRAEARRLAPEKMAEVEAELARLGAHPVRLTARQVEALAGDFYRDAVRGREDDPGTLEGAESSADAAADLAEDPAALVSDGLLSHYLTARGVVADDESRERLRESVARAVVETERLIALRAGGDYSPDANATRFPNWPATAPAAPAVVPFGELVETWKATARPAAKTLYDWPRKVAAFTAFLGHEDAAKVARDDVIRWRDAMLAEGLAPKTIADNRLAPLKAIMGSGVERGRLTVNPFEKVRVTAKANQRESKRAFRDSEVRTILTAASLEKRPLFRWVPWLCALTGARLSEVCQLRGKDVWQEEGVWAVHFSPEAGRLKNQQSERTVPIHSALIAQGFLAFVTDQGEGPLFRGVKPDRFGNRGGNGAKLLGRWVRSLGVDDPRIQPNHGWRHWLKARCGEAGVPDRVSDAITGHAPRTEGARYGTGEGMSLAAMAAQLEKVRVLGLPEDLGVFAK